MRKLLIPALAAGLIALMAPTAHATTRDLTDPAGDVMTATLKDNGDITYNREHGAEGDIVFTRIQHTATQVVVYLRYQQLTVPKQYANFEYGIEGNNDRFAVVGIATRHGQPQGRTYVAASNGRRCAVSHHINYAKDSVSLRIARGCLSSPKYVRVNHLSYRFRMNESTFKVLYDNPARDGGTLNQVSAANTPWVVTG